MPYALLLRALATNRVYVAATLAEFVCYCLCCLLCLLLLLLSQAHLLWVYASEWRWHRMNTLFISPFICACLLLWRCCLFILLLFVYYWIINLIARLYINNVNGCAHIQAFLRIDILNIFRSVYRRRFFVAQTHVGAKQLVSVSRRDTVLEKMNPIQKINQTKEFCVQENLTYVEYDTTKCSFRE